MKLLQRFSLPLAIILGAVLFSLAHAQSAPPPLKPGEKVVTTKDGCGLVVDESKPSAKFESERIAKLTWGGPCVNGLAMGEGWVFEGDYRYLDVPPRKGWLWYGRGIGPAEFRVGSEATSFSFTWDGRTVSYNTLSTTNPVWANNRSDFARRSRVGDGTIIVTTMSRGCILERKSFPECERENKFEIPGVYVLSLETKTSQFHACPNPRSSQGCEALWAQHAGPVIERVKAFVAENTPKVTTAKREVAPLIAHWRPSPGSQQAIATRHAAIRAEHLAEREQREAEQARKQREHDQRMKQLDAQIAAQHAENERLRAIAEQERKEANRRDRQAAMGVLRSFANTSASMGNNKPARQLAVVEIMAGNSPQEIMTILRSALLDAAARTPAIARRLSAMHLPRDISAQDALALLRPMLMEAASRKPDLAKKLAILEALTASSPDEALAIMKPVLTDAAYKRLGVTTR